MMQITQQPSQIKNLFLNLHLIFGKKWIEFWSDSPALMKAAENKWMQSLSNLSDEKIKAGLKRCEDLEFPPSLGEFRELCKTPELDHESFKLIEKKEEARQPRSQESIDRINAMLAEHKHKILKSMESLDD